MRRNNELDHRTGPSSSIAPATAEA
jgi:hypothetical protein